MFKDKATALQNIFMQLAEGNNKILIWQLTEGGSKKNSLYVRLGQVNASQEEMTFYPQYGEFFFDPRSAIYFFGHGRTSVFKASILSHSSLKLVIKLPAEIMLMNCRKEKRQDFTQNRTMIRYTHNPRFNLGLEKMYFQSKLIDLSTTGLAFQSFRENVVQFFKGDHLWIHSPLAGIKSIIEAEIRHVSPIADIQTREKYLKVGVAYSVKL